ncbi:MAG: hypothetical protein AB7G28_11815 [Pirellulales bacterium]
MQFEHSLGILADALMLTYEDKLNRDTQWALEEGGMYFERRSAVHDTLTRLTKSLDELGIDYAVAGAMAMFLHGFRRFTEVVVILVTKQGLAEIHEALEGRGYVKLFAASKNLRDATNGVKIDFILSGQFPGDGKPGPVSFPVPDEVAVLQDGIRVVSLPKLIELKLASGQAAHRLKDLGDVQQLIVELKLPLEIAEQLDPSLRDAYRRIWEGAQSGDSNEF